MKSKILVIDDNKDMRDLLVMVFELEGYLVDNASSGAEALQKLRTDARPDLIFLDHMMNDMDGPAFLKHLERDQPEILVEIPVVMLTGMEPEEAADNRVREVVAKQVGIGPLVAVAKRYLSAAVQRPLSSSGSTSAFRDTSTPDRFQH